MRFLIIIITSYVVAISMLLYVGRQMYGWTFRQRAIVMTGPGVALGVFYVIVWNGDFGYLAVPTGLAGAAALQLCVLLLVRRHADRA